MDLSIADIGSVNHLKPKKGRLLLAEPFMIDDHFSRSVIFICEHNLDGSYGFIINNELNLKLDEIIPDKGLPALDVFYGGPVHASNLFYIHQFGDIINNSIILIIFMHKNHIKFYLLLFIGKFIPYLFDINW